MYEELLAYDAACRELILTKNRIQAGINNTELAREVAKLDKELNTLAARKRTLSKQLEDLAAELENAKKEYDELLQAFLKDKEQQELDANESDTDSKTFESNRRDLEMKLSAVKKIEKALVRIATETDSITTELEKVQKDGTAKFKVIKQKKAELEKMMNKEFEPLKELEEKKDLAGDAVDPELRAKYDNIAISHPDPIAVAANGTCSGCRMSLPSSMVSKVASGSMITCENCGRMIFNH